MKPVVGALPRGAEVTLHPLISLRELLNYLTTRKLITQAQYARCLTSIADSQEE